MIDALSAEFFAGERRARRRAHHLRRRRREAVDLQLPGRRPRRVRRQAPRTSRATLDGARRRAAALRPALLVPLGAADPRAGRRGVRRPGRRGHRRRRSPTTPIAPGRPGPGRALAVPAEAREAGGDRRGTTRVDAPAPDDPVERLAGRDRRAHRRLARRRPGAAGRGPPAIRAGDVMILVQRRGADLRRGDPGAEAGAACRSPAPTCCASAASSRSTTCSRRCASPRPRGDDLSLAAFLRSPLGGLSRARALRAGARPRPGSALARRCAAAPPERWPEARALLDDLRAQADFLRPFELLDADAGAPRRPAQAGRAARRRGRGRHRRAARPGARLRAASSRRA